MLKPKLNAIKKELVKLSAKAPPPGAGTGADWLAIWRFLEFKEMVREVFYPRVHYDRHVAGYYVVLKEAESLGIASDPEVVSGLDKLRQLIDWASAPPRSLSWEEQRALEEMMGKAGSRAAVLILRAWGVLPGLMGPHPPGGRPRREELVLPAWMAEVSVDAPEIARWTRPSTVAASVRG